MLTIARKLPDIVKKHDTYKGFEYIIVYNKIINSNRYVYCWYVKLPKNHKLNSCEFNQIILPPNDPTFKEKDDETDNYWLGFDCWTYKFLEKQEAWSIEYFDLYAKAAIESLIAKSFTIDKEN